MNIQSFKKEVLIVRTCDETQLQQRRSEAARKEEEERQIAAAALAECQRTILALGKQLKGMGTVPELDQPSPNSSSSTESATSIQKMTESMELLRWQTEAVSSLNMHNHTPSGIKDRSSGSPWNNPAGAGHAPRSPSPANSRASNGNSDSHHSSFYLRTGNGNGNGNEHQNKQRIMESSHGNSPICSDTYSAHEGPSIPGSPSAEASLKANGGHQDAQDGEKQQRTSSSFSRFYSRSPS